jgi:hypothetical protein
VLRKFNRDTHSVAVGLWGILVLAAWACVVLTQKRHPPKGDLTERTSPAQSESSSPAATAADLTRTDFSANRSSGAVAPAKSPLSDQKPTERFPKESLGWTQIAAGSTPSPVLLLSLKISHPSDQPNRSGSYQSNSARKFRRKAPYQSHRSARKHVDTEAKKRLLELRRRSLAKNGIP